MSITAIEMEVLKDLREHTRVFLKLDLTYLAAGGAIITALKISRSELVNFSSDFVSIAFAIAFVATFDTVIFSMVFDDWLCARIGTGKRKSGNIIRLLLSIQPYLHLLFVSGLLLGAVNYAIGYHSGLKRIEGRVMLQEEVEGYMQRMESPPKSLNELKASTPRIDGVLKKLNGEDVIIEATGAKSYKLTFAGWDKVFGTQDDEFVTQDLSLRKVFESMTGDAKTFDGKK